MGSMPVGEIRNIWGESPSTSEGERRWTDPATSGEKRCAEITREILKGREQGETHVSPSMNKAPREYDADGEWNLSIGGNQWAIANVRIKIWAGPLMNVLGEENRQRAARRLREGDF